MGKIITVANQKGGVGKTTTSINLGASLAGLGCKVLLIDMDPQGNCTSGMGITPKEGQSGTYEVLIGLASAENTIVPTNIENVDMLPGHINLTAAEVELVPTENRESVLKYQLCDVRNKYDYILIDCPPSLGLLTINALTAADSVLIPLQCEYYAMEGLSQLLNTVRLVREALNRALVLEGILLTMYDQRNNLSKEVMRQVREFFPQEAFKTVIPRNVRLSEAPSYGIPINVYDKSSVGAERYGELAEELLEKNKDLKVCS